MNKEEETKNKINKKLVTLFILDSTISVVISKSSVNMALKHLLTGKKVSNLNQDLDLKYNFIQINIDIILNVPLNLDIRLIQQIEIVLID